MKLIIDGADLEKIRHICEYYPVEGVTTNPTILAGAGGGPFETLKSIRGLIGPKMELHVQVIAREADGMVLDACRIAEELDGNLFVKIPAIPEGFKAMKRLHRAGIKITATAIYTPMQAYLAGQCGASYAAPYINRIDNMGCDGVATAKAIHDIFTKNQIPCQVLAASFKNSQQVLELCQYGIGACTAAPDVIEGMVKHPAVFAAIEDFIADFEKTVGPGKTMADCPC